MLSSCINIILFSLISVNNRFFKTTPAAIFCFRHPLEVALSLARREGKIYEIQKSTLKKNDRKLFKTTFPISRGLFLWIQYNKAAIQNSSELCRVIVHKSTVDTKPYDEAKRIMKELSERCGVVTPPKVITPQFANSFVNGALNHNSQMREGSEKILEIYGKCTIPGYESKYIIGKHEKELYLQAMRVYCDLQNGKAYHKDYSWPEIPEQIADAVTRPTSRETVETEKSLRRMYTSHLQPNKT